ncbi:MAG: DUF4416 family protein [Deltaproteobacteria bacterium]|nr:DUF4416 family protein [Deltaproteobacteria bacterium]
MSNPSEAEDVKLISSLFSAHANLIDRVILEMEGLFGPTDWISPAFFFDRTKYYEKEMGWPLHRRFISFKTLVRPQDIVEIKWKTNALEKKESQRGKRKINIDPGYVALERLVLATGKNYTHRIYLSKGIYADLTLIFQRGSFSPLAWTYKDYGDPEIIDYFNGVRERYKRQIRGLDQLEMETNHKTEARKEPS